MKINSGQAASLLIPEYIGSDFDSVIEVADNIEYIKHVAESIEGIPTSGYIGNTPPTRPKAGAEWYCTTDGRTYIWYEDNDSGQWVEGSPQSSLESNEGSNDDPPVVDVVLKNADKVTYRLDEGEAEATLSLQRTVGGVISDVVSITFNSSGVGALVINGQQIVSNRASAIGDNLTIENKVQAILDTMRYHGLIES